MLPWCGRWTFLGLIEGQSSIINKQSLLSQFVCVHDQGYFPHYVYYTDNNDTNLNYQPTLKGKHILSSQSKNVI